MIYTTGFLFGKSVAIFRLRMSFPRVTFPSYCFFIETTSPKGFLALYSLRSGKEDTQAIEIKEWNKGAHSSFITPAFESLYRTYLKIISPSRVVSSLDLHLHRNTFVAVSVGPGRFTGVRVGISFAKTLGFVLGVPIYPVCSLKVLAESQKEQEKPILVLLNAFKNSLYMALYQRDESDLKEIVSPCVVSAEDLKDKVKTECVCVGDGYAVYENQLPFGLKEKIEVKENIFPEIKNMASLVRREFHSSGLVEWKELVPVYLRSPVKAMM